MGGGDTRQLSSPPYSTARLAHPSRGSSTPSSSHQDDLLLPPDALPPVPSHTRPSSNDPVMSSYQPDIVPSSPTGQALQVRSSPRGPSRLRELTVAFLRRRSKSNSPSTDGAQRRTQSWRAFSSLLVAVQRTDPTFTDSEYCLVMLGNRKTAGAQLATPPPSYSH